MRPTFKYKNFKILFKKNIGIVTGALIFSLFIFFIFILEAYSSYKNENKFAETQVSNLTLVLEQSIQNTFKKIDLSLLTLQDFYVNEKLSTERISFYNKLLLTHKNRLPEVLSIKVVNENGEFFGDDLGYLSKINIHNRDYFQTMKRLSKDQLIISKPVKNITANKWVIVLSRPILSKEGKFKGLILATIEADYFKERFSRLDVGTNGTIGIIDFDSYIYAREPWREGAYGTKANVTATIAKFLKSDEMVKITTSTSKTDGKERLFSTRKMKNFPLAVIVGLSKKEYLLAWKIRFVTTLVLISIFLSIFFFVLVNFLSSLEDVEEHRKQTIQSAKLSSLGEMASGIAHEINNPLTIISFYARSLKRANSLGNNDTKINETAEKIIITVDRIAKIVKGLRLFARDSFNDDIAQTSVSKILDISLELCHEKLKDHSIELFINNQSKLEINCNEIQISQVVINMINNSKDAIQDTDTKWIQIDITKESEFAMIAISDSGKRITDEVFEKLMLPFFTTKEVGKGVGLGLSISKGIIESHGGLFYIDRNKQFNTFVIKIPLCHSMPITKDAA